MNKAEFLNILKEKLLEEMDAREVENNIRYYSDYIEGAVENGKTIQEVLDELGDPLLIARTIIETYDGGKSGAAYEEHNWSNKNVSEADEVRDSFRQFKTKNGWGCLGFAIVLLVVLGIIVRIFGVVISVIAPIIVPLVLIGVFYSFFKKR